MADALKDFFSPSLVKQIAKSITTVHPKFPQAKFVRDASNGLDDLELLARGRHIADALHTHLPAKYQDAAAILVRSLEASNGKGGSNMAPFFYLPHVTFVATHGLAEEDFDVSMNAQHAITQRFTCEWSIRPYLEKYADKTLKVLAKWATDPSEHVRRLVSEGTRSRLPWATRVSWLDKQPERLLPLLEKLKDDPSTYVRRSVANHLNDMSKSHPKLVCEVAERWLAKPTPERQALVKHALRSAIKRGEPGALEVLGFGKAPEVDIADIAFEPKRVAIGKKVRIEFTVASKAKRAQSLAVDLVVHFVKSSGRTSAKVFKMGTANLEARETATFAKGISLAVHTTRKPNPGRHLVEAAINGERFEVGSFVVTGR